MGVFAFVFPMASGHLNPSLPIARFLVAQGHEVHYLCREQLRAGIEDTGAVFHSDIGVQPELYEGRRPDFIGATASLKKEYGLEGDSTIDAIVKLRMVQREMMLPGTIRWLKRLGAHAVLYCPLINSEAAVAALAAGIPSVALLTIAGPGANPPMMAEFLAACGATAEGTLRAGLSFQPNVEAVARMNARYGAALPAVEGFDPVGKMDLVRLSHVTLVTTCEDLQDPLDPELAEVYQREGVRFEAVGPLLDQEGAKRAAGHRYTEQPGVHEGNGHEGAMGQPDNQTDAAELLARVRMARHEGRQVVLASMGTVVTGDHEEFGWNGRTVGADGKPRGLTGRELSQAAWAGIFDVFGGDSAEDGPLIVVSLGPQEDPLGAVEAPPNAVCLPSVPQVDVLRAGVDMFLTHGGQNSFTEALSAGVPLVVCPGFGDQAVNARKAEALGVGLQVPRPDPDGGEEATAAAEFRASAGAAARRVAAEPAFRAKAQACAGRLAQAGGVPRAAEWLLRAAATGAADAKAVAPTTAATGVAAVAGA
uniref:UDP-glycosyltransferases domain-containing protein n=1 Tax=Zooxanthella nutricula TaxID=1333877 RepID=A0A7S2N2S6_9DINO